MTRAFTPVHLQVVNESHMHSVPANSETHFKVTLVSPVFAEQRQVQRHQAVYRVLAAELAASVHALALHTFSPQEWHQAGRVPASPNCLGGGKQS
ncbi:MAG TPA: BolA/IbaG family iron-sulfur metabolism protein [Cellvibrionaceae bacterium]